MDVLQSILAWLNNPAIIMPIQLGLGWVFKRWHATPTKLIPFLNLAVALIARIAEVLAGVPVENSQAMFSTADYTTAAAAGWAHTALDIIVSAVGQTLVTTGVHSTIKNLLQMLLVSAAKKAAT